MKHLLVFSLVFLTLAPSIAHAGAWLREEGTGFVSLSFGATQFSETTNALYLEYGLTEKTTIGLDISAFTNSQNVRNGFGNLFVRRSLGPTDRPYRLAYEVGLGGLWGNERRLPTVKTGLSWGRNIKLGESSGWLNVDAAYIHEPTLGDHITKVDGTMGLNFDSLTTGIIELRAFRQNEETKGSIEPSLLFSPKNRPFNIKLGAEMPFDEKSKTALKFGFWHQF